MGSSSHFLPLSSQTSPLSCFRVELAGAASPLGCCLQTMWVSYVMKAFLRCALMTARSTGGILSHVSFTHLSVSCFRFLFRVYATFTISQYFPLADDSFFVCIISTHLSRQPFLYPHAVTYLTHWERKVLTRRAGGGWDGCSGWLVDIF